MKLSKTGLALIKKFEGCKLKAYKPVDSEKYWTIGWGHYGKDVTEGQVITQAQADELLEKDLQKFINAVNDLVDGHVNQNQFDALVSFTYNLGKNALKSSTLLHLINQGKLSEASKEFDRWVHDGEGNVLKGLVNRRNAEQELFTTPIKTKATTKEKQKYTSIVDYLKDHDMPYDFVSRHTLAKSHGIEGYNGSADQNIKLLDILQA